MSDGLNLLFWSFYPFIPYRWLSDRRLLLYLVDFIKISVEIYSPPAGLRPKRRPGVEPFVPDPIGSLVNLIINLKYRKG